MQYHMLSNHVFLMYFVQAYVRGFNISSWQRHLNPLTWPEILRQFALSAGFGPELKKRSSESACSSDENKVTIYSVILLMIKYM